MAGSHVSMAPDEDRGSQLLAMYWTETAIILVVVALRFYSRILIRSLGIDDWLMLIAIVRMAAGGPEW